MLTKVRRVERLGGLKLRVRFTDGSEGTHDFTTLVTEPGAMLEPLRDEAYFARVFLEFGAPTWPNGFDIAPEWLRREMDAAGELTHIAAERTLLTDGAIGGEANADDEIDALKDCAE